MDQEQNEDWRNERLAQMLEGGKGVDVFFLVGKPEDEKQLISAHKFMLSAMSDMFEGQFLRFNEMTGTQEGSTEEKPIEITDINPGVFRAMLRFIYANDLTGVSKQNVMDLYYAGKKYLIDALVKECRQFLMSGQNLGVDNVWSVLDHGKQHCDHILIAYCWTFVDKNFKDVFESEEFFKLDKTLLSQLFCRTTMGANELFLFQSLHRWAIRKCEADGLANTPENKRKTVGEIIYRIRFPLLTQQEFTKNIVPSGLLTKDDMLAMFLHYANCAECAKVKRSLLFGPLRWRHCSDCADAKRQYPNRFSSQRRYSPY